MNNYQIGLALEPSTVAGVVGLLTLFGVNISPEHATAIIQGAAALVSVIGLFIRQKRPSASDNQAKQ